MFWFKDSWWHKHVQLDPSMSEFYEDDGIEIDDASLLAITNLHANRFESASTNGESSVSFHQHVDGDEFMMPPGMECSMTLMDFLDSYADGEDSEQRGFMKGFRTEVAEVSLMSPSIVVQYHINFNVPQCAQTLSSKMGLKYV